MPLIKSWVDSANRPKTEFPLNNLPYGVFSVGDNDWRCGVAIGDRIVDVTALEEVGLLRPDPGPHVFDVPFWNDFMELGPQVWASFRTQLQALLAEDNANREAVEPHLVEMADAELHMPFAVAEYTDFYSGCHHATNVGAMFRGADNALPPNWLHIPIGYNGRASSVYVSGTDIRRPWGQLKSPDHALPAFLPCRRFDIELEMGAIVGQPSDGPVSVQQADDMIFGYVLLNDWSARDIQAWEYQPLGPFQAKATATSISPWIVTKAALEPFRTSTPEREKDLLPHLAEPGPMLYNIPLSVSMQPENAEKPTVIARTNYSQMYYSAAQQLAHHTTAGSPMNTGDLLGSGTISGPTKPERGSLLELCWGGKEPMTLDTGETRTFIEDGDTLTLCGAAQGDGYRIGFGDCTGRVVAALDKSVLPYPD
ncbi:MAG: fumarylacetoacetase [Rhodobacteraceae bacterium]|nr:fumarylacetoacetase [Paracoccaceae bacterium]